MNRRIEAVRAVLIENGLDAIVVTKQQNWQYISGFTGSNALILITPADNILITDFRYIEQASQETSGFDIVKAQVLMEDALAEQVLRLGINRLGFEEDNLTYRVYSTFKTKLADVELVPVYEVIEKTRWVKDDSEIQLLKKAADITDIAFGHILGQLKPGTRENEVSLELEYFMKKMGAEKTAFDIIVASGPRGALPHGSASGKQLANGELVVIDFGAVVSGYHSDMTRTVVIGEADNEQRQIYDIVLKAQEKAIAAIKPGLQCSHIDMIARDLITSNGYGANFGHSLGHSVGLEIHEKPSFSPRDDTVLEPGMVLTVEPGIYLAGWGGVRIEDLVVVTENGCEVISKSPKHLMSLG